MGRPPQCYSCCPTTTTTTTTTVEPTTTIPPTTTSTTTTLCPTDGGCEVFCRYEFVGGEWTSVWAVKDENCLCSCPGPAIALTVPGGTSAEEGQCLDITFPCCPPCAPCFTGDIEEECFPTTTTTTTTTTEEPVPTAVVVCLGEDPDCCDDPAFAVVGDSCCEDDPHGRTHRRPPRSCSDFPSFSLAFEYHQDLGRAGHLAYLFSNKTCAEIRPSLPFLTCPECTCVTTTTTTAGPTTTTTVGPTTTTTSGPTTTTTVGPTTTTTGGPTTTTTSGPTTTTTAGLTTTTTTEEPCDCPCPETLNWTVSANSFGPDCSFSASSAASDTIADYDGGCNGTYTYNDAGSFACGDTWTSSITCDSSKAGNSLDRWTGSAATCVGSFNGPNGADNPGATGSCGAPPSWTFSAAGSASCFCCEDQDGGGGGPTPDPINPQL